MRNATHAHRGDLRPQMWLCILVAATPALVAQVRDRGEDLELLLQNKAAATVTPSPGVALESPVDQGKYYVGPSDVIAVNIWTSPPINLSLTVTPEGTLIIPTVGEVVVSDMLLSKAKGAVLSAVKRKYLTAEVTVTLVKPRNIVVTVLGNVTTPGLYTLSSVDRATRALEEANRPIRASNQATSPIYPEDMSTRSIVVKHRDGSQARVDLSRFMATKEDVWNPYLREGDVLIVPKKNPLKNVFGIYGEVNSPGRYEFVAGDSAIDALSIAQGFTRLALRDSVEFSSLNEDGTALSIQVINLERIRDRLAPNLPLHPGDRIVVRAKPELREDYRVYVGGEVLFPGIYPITKNKTKLSNVIKRAGGFTEFAWLETAELGRRSLRPEEVELDRLMSLRGGASPEDSSYYLIETELRLRKEIVNVDFQKLFLEGDSTQDVILQTEDNIYVPSKKKTIYVFGQVVAPGHVPFVEGEGYEYYVSKAGGLTERARGGDLKIVKAKSRQWLSPRETTIEEGDYVWVPKEPERSFAYYMNIVGQTASVVSVAVSIVLLVIQSKK